MLDGLKSKAARTAKRAGLMTGGLLAFAVGLAFLTVAGWIYLVAVTDTLTAALIVGGVYTGVGLIMLGVASAGQARDSDPVHDASHAVRDTSPSAQPPLMQAFLHGMQAGVSATQPRP